MRRAGDKRWRAAVEVRFQQVKQSRLASAALACEQLINQATTRLSQVCHDAWPADAYAWHLHAQPIAAVAIAVQHRDNAIPLDKVMTLAYDIDVEFNHLYAWQSARAPGATMEQLQAELAAFDKEYAASPVAAGPVKWRRHAEFMRDTCSDSHPLSNGCSHPASWLQWYIVRLPPTFKCQGARPLVVHLRKAVM